MLHPRTDYDHIQDPSGKIPEDEPVALFRAQDTHAPCVLEYYANRLENDGNNEMATMMRKHAKRMRDWQVEVKEKLPDTPGDTIR